MPSTLTTLALAARTWGSRAIFESGGRTLGARAVYLRKGIEAGERLQDGSRGGKALVERSQDRRLLDWFTQLPRAWRMQRNCASDPDETQAKTAHEQRPAEAIEQAETVAQAPAQVKTEQLEARRKKPADQQGTNQSEQWRVRRLRALFEEQRTQARTK